MAPDVATAETAHPRRGGMGRRFADEESLSTPGDDAAIRNFWYPVHFEAKLARSADADKNTFVLFGETCALRRANADDAAKAIAPLWGESDGESDANAAEADPSPRARAATPDGFVCESVDTPGRFMPVGVRDGLVMVWPGTCRPARALPASFRPPEGYTTHAELIIECVPVEHGLLMENLLDLAHAPFTHTGTFAKGWGVPNFVEFVSKQMRKPGDGWHDMANAIANAGGANAPVSVKKLVGMNGDLEGQQGSWNPYPIDMKFVTPCMVDSHIGMSQAGAAGGRSSRRGCSAPSAPTTCTSCTCARPRSRGPRGCSIACRWTSRAGPSTSRGSSSCGRRWRTRCWARTCGWSRDSRTAWRGGGASGRTRWRTTSSDSCTAGGETSPSATRVRFRTRPNDEDFFDKVNSYERVWASSEILLRRP